MIQASGLEGASPSALLTEGHPPKKKTDWELQTTNAWTPFVPDLSGLSSKPQSTPLGKAWFPQVPFPFKKRDKTTGETPAFTEPFVGPLGSNPSRPTSSG